MIILNEDTIKYLKKKYMKICIIGLINFVCLYTISKKVEEHEYKINNLTKKIKELKTKGD